MIELTRRFVPAADEVWRLQRGDDPESRFFQGFADRGHSTEPGGSRQGIYVVAPSGELLASTNALDAGRVLEVLHDGLTAWEGLPAERRYGGSGPGGVSGPAGVSGSAGALGSAGTLGALDELARAPRWEDSAPVDGLVLRSVARDLPVDLDPRAEPLEPYNVDHVWMSAEEARSPEWAEVLVERLARFHLVDQVRGQTLPFAVEEVVEAELACEPVGQRGPDRGRVRYRIEGRTRVVAEGPWLLGEGDWEPEREWPRSVTTRIGGEAVFDRDRGRFVAFDLVAIGWRTGRTANDGRSEREAVEGGAIGFRVTLAEEGERVPPAFVDVYDDGGWIVGVR